MLRNIKVYIYQIVLVEVDTKVSSGCFMRRKKTRIRKLLSAKRKFEVVIELVRSESIYVYISSDNDIYGEANCILMIITRRRESIKWMY